MNWLPEFIILLSSFRLCLHHSGVCVSGYEFAVNGKFKIIIIINIIIIIILRTATLNFIYNRNYRENLDQRRLWKIRSFIHLNYVITHLSNC
jgi:cytochrome c biogenesis factor